MSTDPKLIEAVARAYAKIADGAIYDAMPPESREMYAKRVMPIIAAYEAARGDVVVVPRSALELVRDNVGNDDGPRTDDGWRSDKLQSAIDEVDRAIAASQGER